MARGLPLHVDACFGGFMLPWCVPLVCAVVETVSCGRLLRRFMLPWCVPLVCAVVEKVSNARSNSLFATVGAPVSGEIGRDFDFYLPKWGCARLGIVH